MRTFTVESDGTYIVTLERSFEILPHLVFRGENFGLTHRIYPDYVIEGERLDDTLQHLRKKIWMSDELFDAFLAEILWLQSQLDERSQANQS